MLAPQDRENVPESHKYSLYLEAIYVPKKMWAVPDKTGLGDEKYRRGCVCSHCLAAVASHAPSVETMVKNWGLFHIEKGMKPLSS